MTIIRPSSNLFMPRNFVTLYINKVKVNNPDAIKAEVVRYYPFWVLIPLDVILMMWPVDYPSSVSSRTATD